MSAAMALMLEDQQLDAEDARLVADTILNCCGTRLSQSHSETIWDGVLDTIGPEPAKKNGSTSTSRCACCLTFTCSNFFRCIVFD